MNWCAKFSLTQIPHQLHGFGLRELSGETGKGAMWRRVGPLAFDQVG